MIPINPTLSIDDHEIKMEFIRSSGPGGQNVNKVSTAVLLRFDVINSPSLPESVKKRLIRLSGSRVSEAGILNIKVQVHRKQDQNRKEAILRLVALIQRAAEKPKPRHKTQPTFASRQRRLEAKQHNSRIKTHRKPVGKDEF
ncbi:MAG: aminoacyl-tRNA hydrolase [Desulfobacteraceae bacterium]|nr:aminoacyl-tRNA hydrolase [Desulfobacteraceae bacterium]MBU4002166.1 aminoacyl-tRNA hydrolase [Pseudomonadota bacterium]MBU4055335.1 aminoacyl-tRNA hydrolase [Pseudomonadota bacterium]